MIARRRLALWAALGGAVLATAGCGTGGMATGKGADKAHGKELFQQKCGSCHTLADAGTQGKVGPNLDDAFSGVREQGFAESTIRNVVRDQILFPVTNPAGVVKGPGGTSQRAPGMPAKLVTGNDARDVAAYVASVAGISATAGATTTTATTTTPATTPTAGGGSQTAVGKQVFQSAGCASCHTLEDAGASGTVGPNLDEKKPPKALIVDRVTNGKGVMPSFKGQLSAEQIQAVAEYVSSVAGT